MAHLKSGGSFDDCVPLMEALVESDFFAQPNSRWKTRKLQRARNKLNRKKQKLLRSMGVSKSGLITNGYSHI